VSSGAIGAGMNRLGLAERPKTIPGKQSVAAVGQGLLMAAYDRAFSRHKRAVGQMLLTGDDFLSRQRYSNARNTINALFESGIVPVINENDTVAVEELKVGDNDNLSALVANLISADLLVILSDVDGLFDSDPRRNSGAKLISDVKKIDSNLEKMSRRAGSSVGTGGIFTKIQAAKKATAAGTAVVIANGQKTNVLRMVINGENIGTLFHPAEKCLGSRKRWIAFGAAAKGGLVVDEGAEHALRTGKSLLPSGILSCRGKFRFGDAVTVVSAKNQEIGRGLVNFSSEEIERIKGKKTSEIESILGYKNYDEVIHCDSLALLGGK